MQNKKMAFISAVITIGILASIVPGKVAMADSTKAVEVAEPNNSRYTATKMELGTTYYDEIGSYEKYCSDGQDADFFSVDLEKDQYYMLTIDGYMEKFSYTSLIVTIINPENESASIHYKMDDVCSDYMLFTTKYTGTYYFKLHNYFEYYDRNKDTSYSIRIDKSEPEIPYINQTGIAVGDNYGDPNENNGSKYTATYMEIGKTYIGEIGSLDRYNDLHQSDVDVFCVDLVEGNTYKITMTGYADKFAQTSLIGAIISPFDAIGSFTYELETLGVDDVEFTTELSGKFYIKIYNFVNSSGVVKDTSYSLRIDLISTSVPTATVTPIPTKTPTTTTPKPSNSTGTSTAKPTSVPSNGGETTTESGVGGFVERLYTVAMGRESDPSGKFYWENEVKVNGKTGADLGLAFLLSPEFLGKNMTNEQFLEVLYETFFDRAGEEGGKNYWIGELTSGRKTKTDVIYGFVNSEEWANICLTYGIKSGTEVQPTITIAPSQDIKNFAERLYTTCLNRPSEAEGLNYWANELANLRKSGSEVAKGFFFSEELQKSGISDAEFLTRLYKTVMGREPETAGYNYWLGQMKSGAMSRSDVFDGFAASAEWIGICADYGILR